MPDEKKNPACAGCHEHSMWHEFICHVPYTALSLAIGFAIAGFLYAIGNAITGENGNIAVLSAGYNVLFHIFHFLHI